MITATYERIRSLELMIELERVQISSLELRYGTSIRPDWVGEDIGISMAHIQSYEAELRELEKACFVASSYATKL